MKKRKQWEQREEMKVKNGKRTTERKKSERQRKAFMRLIHSVHMYSVCVLV